MDHSSRLAPTGRELKSLAQVLLHGHQDHEDIAQEVWLLYQGRDRRIRNPPGWLKAAILRMAMRRRRSECCRKRRERIVARPERLPSVADHCERQAERLRLVAMVQALSEPYREIVRLRYLESLEIEAMATLLGRSPSTVRSQLKRGLDQLRSRMAVDARSPRFLGLEFSAMRDRGLSVPERT